MSSTSRATTWPLVFCDGRGGQSVTVLAAIGQSLPIAVGLLLAAIPMVIVAVLLVIKRPAAVAVAFLAGWVLGLAVVGGVVVAVADLLTLPAQSPWWANCIKIGLGVVLLVMAARKWRARPRSGEQATVPKWMAATETITGGKAFGLALLLASVNPKHLVLVVAGATVIADATPRVHEQVIALVVFVAVASLGVAAPAIASRVLGERSGAVLAAADRWMTAHNATIMAVVLAVLGTVMVVNGVAGLV
jgi:threonine/homoserine/homoserine lactone efflux protein